MVVGVAILSGPEDRYGFAACGPLEPEIVRTILIKQVGLDREWRTIDVANGGFRSATAGTGSSENCY